MRFARKKDSKRPSDPALRNGLWQAEHVVQRRQIVKSVVLVRRPRDGALLVSGDTDAVGHGGFLHARAELRTPGGGGGDPLYGVWARRRPA